MEEPVGAQYAVHIALHTLKDRCRNLQQRVTALEEENLNLRVQCTKNEEVSVVPLSEMDNLKGQVTELSEHKQQLLNKVKMVTNENQELWNKLSRLTHANQSMGNQLNKINDSLLQYSTKSKDHQPLIRSKTFTQDEPHTKVLQRNLEENGKICAELEEISLKIINSFAQGKSELDSLYSEITEIQYGDNLITDSCGFYYDDYDNNIMDNFNGILDELKATKEVVFSQKVALKLVLDKLGNLQEIKKKICDNNSSKTVEMVDKGTSTLPPVEPEDSPIKSPQKVLPEPNTIQHSSEQVDMICPMCSKYFPSNTDYQEFTGHVEKHFTEDETFELL